MFFIVKDGKVLRKAVKTGYETDTYIEVIDGVAEGEEVVTAGQASLKDDSTVTVVTSNS